MTSTRDTGKPQALKITLREALGNATRRRGEGKPHHAAAQARETLIADPATGESRRRALSAHLLGSSKGNPRPG
jgi:hypothetical protein